MVPIMYIGSLQLNTNAQTDQDGDMKPEIAATESLVKRVRNGWWLSRESRRNSLAR